MISSRSAPSIKEMLQSSCLQQSLEYLKELYSGIYKSMRQPLVGREPTHAEINHRKRLRIIGPAAASLTRFDTLGELKDIADAAEDEASRGAEGFSAIPCPSSIKHGSDGHRFFILHGAGKQLAQVSRGFGRLPSYIDPSMTREERSQVMKARMQKGNKTSREKARGSPLWHVVSVASKISNLSYLRGAGDIKKTSRYYDECRGCNLWYLSLKSNLAALKHASDSKHEMAQYPILFLHDLPDNILERLQVENASVVSLLAGAEIPQWLLQNFVERFCV